LKSSFEISYKIAKAGKNHTIGETLIKPVILQTVSTMLDQNAAQKFEEIHLSARTVKRYIGLHRKQFDQNVDIQSDFFHAADVADLALILVYVRYISHDEIKESMLFL
jgi:zinc finger BED domain-containing protein 5/7/8/9